jgi:hypothetical protein
MKDLTSKELDETLDSPERVAIFFYSAMCGHCHQMQEPWNELEKEEPSIKFVKVEANNITPKGKAVLKTQGFPEFQVREGKKLKKSAGGSQPKEELKKKLFGTRGGKRRRSLRLAGRVRKTRHRTARRKVAF